LFDSVETDRLVEPRCALIERPETVALEVPCGEVQAGVDERSANAWIPPQGGHVEVSQTPNQRVLDKWVGVEAAEAHDTGGRQSHEQAFAGCVAAVDAGVPLRSSPCYDGVPLGSGEAGEFGDVQVVTVLNPDARVVQFA